MKNVENVYGTGVLYGEEDLQGTIFTRCCACMNVYAEYLSWANEEKQLNRFKPVDEAQNIIVLGCQLNDLAVLNDLHHIERLMNDNTNAKFYVGGCLAKRFDIELPKGVIRLDTLQKNNQWIYNTKLVDYASPFWVEKFDPVDCFVLDTEKFRFLYNQGHLFRNSYPLRIGGGCPHGSAVGGKSYRLPVDKDKFNEFVIMKDVVLIAGELDSNHVLEWILIAQDHHKSFSLRNVSPSVVVEMMGYLETLARSGSLTALHTIIHNVDEFALRDMGLDVGAVSDYMKSIKFLKPFRTIIGATVTTGYKTYPNTPSDVLSKFDYVTSIYHWDGMWNREMAEIRWGINFPWSKR